MRYEEFELISIIMAAYNAEKTIEQAIDSVLKQTYSNFELLIIDDFSQDRTRNIATKFAMLDNRVKLILNDQNKGVSFTRKRGLEEAKGAWIAILDSDDAWKSNKLEKQMILQKRTNADLLFTGSDFMDKEGNRLDWSLHVPTKISYKQLLKQNIISNSSALVRKTLYEQYYAVGDDMHEDYATWLNILKTGRKAYGVDESLLIYRVTNTSKSGNKFKSARMNWNTYRYIGLSFCASIYYESWYMIKGLLKYKNLNRF